ncbi:MAG: alpha/beta fold hydrolase [Sphingobacteriales bacterium]|nr:MAG: alpha/beta fold hydrolase [Sphingobacteriales bacterium]
MNAYMMHNAQKLMSSGHEQTYFLNGTSRALPPVVFIHGFPHTHRLWDEQVQALSQHYTVITYDLRGFGQSVGGEMNHSLDFYVSDLMALLDHLKIEKATIAGLSMGGYIALRAISKFPDRIHALILADTSADTDQNSAKLKRYELMTLLDQKGLEPFIDTFIKGVLLPTTLEKHPERLTQLRAMMSENQPQALSGALAAMAGRLDSNDSLSAITVPTLILVGEKDPSTPPELAAKLHDKIKGSILVKIPHAGHLSNWENPDAFNHAVTEFLGRRFRE